MLLVLLQSFNGYFVGFAWYPIKTRLNWFMRNNLRVVELRYHFSRLNC